jgi:putative ABC transport system substrate-binding protein
MASHIERRKFLATLGGAAAAWPLDARAQQSAMPVIGYLESRSPDGMTDRLRAFRQGLKDTGYVEGENVRIEYRWAENQVDRLPMLATELVRQRVNVIATTGGEAVALAAKAATKATPIVFGVSQDPVPFGLVASHSRPRRPRARPRRAADATRPRRRGDRMNRREFITLFGGAAASPT